MVHLKKTISAFVFICFCLKAFPQDSRGKNEIGLQVGGSFYTGDLAPSIGGTLKTARPAIGIYYNRYLGNYFSIRANLMAGGLFGDDSLNANPEYMRRRKFRFHSPLAEASLLAQFDIFGTNGSIPTNKISPYVFAGVGAAFINVHRDWSRIDSSMIHVGGSTLAGLIKDSSAQMPNVLPVVPVGAGIKYHAWPRVALTFEANYRIAFTDYIDGFSYAANPGKNDGYYSLTIGAVYNFGGGSGSGGGFGGGRKSRRGSIGCPTKVY